MHGASIPAKQINKVHLVFKTHLDLGFTDLASVVARRYFNDFIPKAITLAAQSAQGDDKFVWTTGSWLIYEALERSTPTHRTKLESAINQGFLNWHALPFTLHSELLDASMFEFGLSISKELDYRYGRKTISAKMTDVPGHTRGIVPLLAAAGIKFLHIGTNPVSPAPAIPRLCIWRDEETSTEIVLAYNEGGYGNAIASPDGSELLAFVHTEDNIGPCNATDVKCAYETMRATYPKATIVAQGMDEFANTCWTQRAQLPVVTEEIGDTWIHGSGSDPLKMSHFRQLLRWRSQIEHNDLTGFSRHLLCVAEHTWGRDVKCLGATVDGADAAEQAYEKQQFARFRLDHAYFDLESSWREQRGYLESAVRSLPVELQRKAEEQLRLCDPEELQLDGWAQTTEIPNDVLLGSLSYQVFSSDDYERFFREYNINTQEHSSWHPWDFGKPGLEKLNRLRAALTNQSPSTMWQRNDEKEIRIVLQSDAELNERYGLPEKMWIDYRFDSTVNNIAVNWSGKPASRIPEAMWFTFRPVVADPAAWRMKKLDRLVSPLEIAPKGNRSLHAVQSIVHPEVEIINLDAALVAPGAPNLLRFSEEQPDLSQGFHFNLFNNIWGTNFPLWTEGSAKFRFIVRKKL